MARPVKKSKKRKRASAPRRAARARPGYSARDRELALGVLGKAFEEALEGIDPHPVLDPETLFAVRAVFYERTEDLRFPGESEEERAYIEDTSEYAFFWWFFFDLRSDGRSLARELFSGGPFPKGVRAFVREAELSELHLYRVEAVTPGVGMTLASVVGAHPPAEVREKRGSEGLEVGDVIAARVLRSRRGELILESGMLFFEPGRRERVVQLVEAFWAEEPLEGTERAATLACLLHASWRTPEVPEIVAADGDAFALVTRVYAIDGDVDGAMHVLDEQPELEVEHGASIAWMWRAPPDEGDGAENGLILGAVSIDDDADPPTLEIFAETRERAAALAKIVEEALGEAIRFVESSVEDAAALLTEP